MTYSRTRYIAWMYCVYPAVLLTIVITTYTCEGGEPIFVHRSEVAQPVLEVGTVVRIDSAIHGQCDPLPSEREGYAVYRSGGHEYMVMVSPDGKFARIVETELNVRGAR